MTYRVVEQEWVEAKNEAGRRTGWVCKHCKHETETVYIATGHDHTDFSITVCTCGNGERFQDEYTKEARYAHPTHPIEDYKKYFS